MKKILIPLSALALIVQGLQAQGTPPDFTPPPPPENMPPEPPMPPEMEIPEEILDLHAEVKMLRDELRESRRAVLEELGDEATRDEIAAALSAWRDDNMTTIEEMRALTEELRDAIRENRPGPGGFEIPDEVVELRGELQEQRKALAESRRAVVEALGEDATDEEIRAAIEQWREDNADAIAETRALAEEIRTWFRENRPERPGGGPPAHVLQRRAAFKDNAKQIRQNRQEMAKKLRAAGNNKEERKQIVQQFREEQRQLIRERKELKRQQRQDQVGAGGDRRPGG
ncbi:MAG: hypothetical protein GVY10_11445 [Verrucomicrobia bacterium]|nr:hypothetical protein [Verrucomicrobiota bacterium]